LELKFTPVPRSYVNKITDLYICIINNNYKHKFNFTLTDIGIFLYNNLLLTKMNNILITTDIIHHKYNNAIYNDTINLFKIYVSDLIEDNI
jgi:hypothetical protein